MRLRTVAKLGMVLSVVLFCTAVGFYGFAKLSLTDKSREINLFSLVPADCIGVLESDNINYFLNEFPQLNYSEELGNFQFPGLFNYVLGGLNEYTTNTAHGLSSKMSRVVVSFHSPGTPRDQVVYFRMEDRKLQLAEKLRNYIYRYGINDFNEEHHATPPSGKPLHRLQPMCASLPSKYRHTGRTPPDRQVCGTFETRHFVI